MAFGNAIGFAEGRPSVPHVSEDGRSAVLDLFTPRYFAFLIEHIEPLPPTLNAQQLGHSTAAQTLVFSQETHDLADLRTAWTATLEPVYPTKAEMAKIVDRRTLSNRPRYTIHDSRPHVLGS